MMLAGVLLAVISPVSAAALERLLADLDELRGADNVPAYAFTLVSADTVLHADAHGVADLASARAATAETRFRIGSITKTFTALAILLAIEQGALALDTRFAEIAGPDLIRNPWSDSAPVRIANLLEHTAGLSDLDHDEMYHSDPTPVALADAVRDFANNRRVLWRPGEHYSYSNAGAGLAAYALELSSGESYEDFVGRRLFRPLAMNTASLLLDTATRAHLATGYDSDGRTPIPYWHMLFRPFGAINASAKDMVGPLMLMLNRGKVGELQLLPAHAIRRMERPRTTLAARHGLDFGYGLGLYSWYYRGHRFFGHGGDGDGYLAHFGYNRSAGLAYCLIINVFDHAPLRRMRERIEDFIVAGIKPLPVAPLARPPDDTTFYGTYRAATVRFGEQPDLDTVALRVIKRNGATFTARAHSSSLPLLPVRSALWRRPEEPDATIAIVRDSTGRWVVQGERESFVHIQPQR